MKPTRKLKGGFVIFWIARKYDIPIDRSWSRLTRDEKRRARKAMEETGSYSVNDVKGFHWNLRRWRYDKLRRHRLSLPMPTPMPVLQHARLEDFQDVIR